MIRPIPSFVAVFGLAMLLGVVRADDKPADKKEDPTQADMEKCTGTWVVKSVEGGGQEVPKELFAGIKLVIDHEKYEVQGLPEGKDSGTTKLDAEKQPKQMEITAEEGPNKGKTIRAIYEIEGDEFKVCYAFTGEEFPTEFKTAADDGRFIIVYEREKKE